MTSTDGSYDGARIAMVSAYTIDAGVTVQGNGSISDNWNGEGAELVVNQGLIDANVGGNWLYIDPTGFINQGVVQASNGGGVNVDPSFDGNLTNGVLTGGTFEADANSIIEFAGNPAITTDAADIVEKGADLNVGYIYQTLTTIAAAGRLELDSGASLTDNNALDDQGAIVLGGGTSVFERPHRRDRGVCPETERYPARSTISDRSRPRAERSTCRARSSAMAS